MCRFRFSVRALPKKVSTCSYLAVSFLFQPPAYDQPARKSLGRLEPQLRSITCYGANRQDVQTEVPFPYARQEEEEVLQREC